MPRSYQVLISKKMSRNQVKYSLFDKLKQEKGTDKLAKDSEDAACDLRKTWGRCITGPKPITYITILFQFSLGWMAIS